MHKVCTASLLIVLSAPSTMCELRDPAPLCESALLGVRSETLLNPKCQSTTVSPAVGEMRSPKPETVNSE